MSDPSPTQITLGHGPIEFEIFLEPTCPYSKRAFNKLKPLLAQVGESEMTIVIRLLSQPWHLFTGVVTRCVIAATATEGGSAAGWHVLDTVFSHREDFITNNEFSGPNMEIGFAGTIARISDLSGIDLFEPFKLDTVGQAFIWHTKYSRQNGAHMTPSFAINRILDTTMDSAQSVQDWVERVKMAKPVG